MNSIITLREYLGKNKVFIIPDYQRGYVWGKNRVGSKDSVTYIMEDMLRRYESKTELFLQGMTVTEKSDCIEIIDGQQRTTFLFLLFKCLGYNGKFLLDYRVRKESFNFLKNINVDDVCYDTLPDRKNEDIQDKYFFKKTVYIIKTKLEGVDKAAFLDYLLENVKFLYIDIPEQQAENVFTMMNGSKAQMRVEELIKAEMLRLISVNETSDEWYDILLRSRLAREWDKWLYWWNKPEVQTVFRCYNPMGLLLVTYWEDKKNDRNSHFSFEAFKEDCLRSGKSAKEIFVELRRLQKRFEDAFNAPSVYNKVGAILRIMRIGDQKKFIKDYFIKRSIRDLDNYYRCAFLDMTHHEIVNIDGDKFCSKYENCRQTISGSMLYVENKEVAFRLLLRLNIDEDNKQNNSGGRKFDFTIWDKYGIRSIEHIYPKSKVVHWQEDDNRWHDGNGDVVGELKDFCHDDKRWRDGRWNEYLQRDSIQGGASEHSIGNLALLYRDDNSTLGANDYVVKKNYFFNIDKKEYFKSRHLLHTIYLFAKSEWGSKEIEENQKSVLKKFDEYYEHQKIKYGYDKQD